MKKTLREFIKKYELQTVEDNTKIGTFTRAKELKANKSDLDFIHANKAELIKEYLLMKAEEEKERKETEAHVIKFYVTGWGSHQVSIDNRMDLKEQFVKIADYYKNDGITVDSVEKAYQF